MRRSMTPEERARFEPHFPVLDLDAVVVTADPANAYNCISWTLGFTDRWLWPGAASSSFDTFYAKFGFERGDEGPIAAWGTNTSNMTHGSISGPTHGPRWESKCGADLRIEHDMNELEGSLYGRILTFYRPRSERIFEDDFESMVAMNPSQSMLSSTQQRELARERGLVPAKVRAAFDKAFAAWKKTWFRGGQAISSNIQTRGVGPEFDRLIALGPAIMPLVVFELAKPENFIALVLYEAIQPDSRLHVQIAPDDERILEGEQGRAQRLVQAWLASR